TSNTLQTGNGVSQVTELLLYLWGKQLPLSHVGDFLHNTTTVHIVRVGRQVVHHSLVTNLGKLIQATQFHLNGVNRRWETFLHTRDMPAYVVRIDDLEHIHLRVN